MRRIHVAVFAVAAALFSFSCADRGPTAPEAAASANRPLSVSAPPSCVGLPWILAEADSVFGQKSPNSNSVRGKIDLIAKALTKGDSAQARDHAFKTVSFVLLQYKSKKGVVGTAAQVARLSSHVLCFAGIGGAIADPLNAVVVEPSSSTQVVTNATATAGVKFPAGSLGETTVLEFVPIAAPSGGWSPGAGPLLTKLDQYPGFYNINAYSATNHPLVSNVVVGVCPLAGIDTLVRNRLRLGHQAGPLATDFEVTPAADASFLSCPTQTASIDRLPSWLRSVATTLLPRALYARPPMAMTGGVGGTAGAFSPFGPVDLELNLVPGGVGGTAGAFQRQMKSRDAKPEDTPSSPTQQAQIAQTSTDPKSTTASGVRLLNPGGSCSAIDAPWGMPVDSACRPTVTVKTHLNTPLVGVPVTWSVESGGGRVAPVLGAGCGVYADSAAATTDSTGKARVCWAPGDSTHIDSAKVRARPRAGGDAPAGVTFTPPSVVYTATVLKRTPVVLISCVDSIFNGLDRNPCSAVAKDAVTSAVIGSASVTYLPGTPHDAGTYTANATFVGSARYFGAVGAPVTFYVFADFLSAARNLAVGETTACAIAASNALYCWGDNAHAELGLALSDTTTLREYPTAPAGLQHSFVQLSYGNGQFFCGIDAARSAICWGRGQWGELGGGTLGGLRNLPATVLGGISWANIFTGRLSTCGVSVAGIGYCWGSNQWGEVGNSSVPVSVNPATSGTTAPLAVEGGLTFTSVVTGWLHACGISSSGSAYCWGQNSYGQLGIGAADFNQTHLTPAPVAGGLKFIQLSLGARYTCGITVDHRGYCWGENYSGQLGDGTTTNRGSPTPVAGGHHFAYIASGSGFEGNTNTPPPPSWPVGSIAHTCALAEDGTAFCWGRNGNGQLGDGTSSDRSSPAPVLGTQKFTSLGVGGASTCGRNGNLVSCWGGNGYGQLGNGAKVDSWTPVQVMSPFNLP